MPAPGWLLREDIIEHDGMLSYDAPTTVAQAYTGAGSWPGTCNVINWAYGLGLKPSGASVPSYVQSNGNGTPTDGLSLANWSTPYTGNNLVHSCLIAVAVFNGTYQTQVTDTQGNTWVLISSQHIPFSTPTINILLCADCKAGPNTVTFTPTGGFGSVFNYITAVVHEYSGVLNSAPLPCPSPNGNSNSPAPTGCLDVISLLAAGPAQNSFSAPVTTLTANDLLFLVAATDPACVGFMPQGSSVVQPSVFVVT